MGVVTINSIRDGVNAALDHFFPSIPIMGEEIKQGLEEPCFFVKLLEGSQTQELGTRYKRAHQFDVHYFEVENRKLHNMAEQLYDILGLIQAGDTLYRGTNMKHEIVDGVLHFFVDYTILVRRDTPAMPIMQTIEQEGNIRG